jgi:hypothetical protein
MDTTVKGRTARTGGRALRLLQVPGTEVRKGDLVCSVPGHEVERVVRVEASRWRTPGRTTLVWFRGKIARHFLEDVPVFVVRREEPAG